ncbi:hypothetical protein K443DRAFT_75122, partial [Laccaria amethystina LaAM-08-1]
QCPPFQTTKIGSVRFLRLQKLVVCAFFHYKMSTFFLTKVCSVRFLSLQKLVVSAFN